ncbi:MAG: S4 domain-containing protein [Steroidobacteraceae bacterium]
MQKILARAGLASRREAEEWIRQGRVTVNGEVATLGTRAEGKDHVKLDGRLIRQAPIKTAATFLCHRSPGESLREPREGEDRGALAERLPKRSGKRFIAVSPMPHIDGGLELLTADGELAARLQRAVRRLELVFSLRVRGSLDERQLAGILGGELDAGHVDVTSCELQQESEGSNRWYEVVTRGANGKELRQLVERQGASLSRVLRTRFGSLQLDRHLKRGQARELTTQELADLLTAIEAPVPDSRTSPP